MPKAVLHWGMLQC